MRHILESFMLILIGCLFLSVGIILSDVFGAILAVLSVSGIAVGIIKFWIAVSIAVKTGTFENTFSKFRDWVECKDETE